MSKKLYQTTRDGDGDQLMFHKKYDNILNTILLFKSAGNRRFRSFIFLSWKSKGKRTIDKNCFLFWIRKKFIIKKIKIIMKLLSMKMMAQ